MSKLNRPPFIPHHLILPDFSESICTSIANSKYLRTMSQVTQLMWFKKIINARSSVFAFCVLSFKDRFGSSCQIFLCNNRTKTLYFTKGMNTWRLPVYLIPSSGAQKNTPNNTRLTIKRHKLAITMTVITLFFISTCMLLQNFVHCEDVCLQVNEIVFQSTMKTDLNGRGMWITFQILE